MQEHGSYMYGQFSKVRTCELELSREKISLKVAGSYIFSCVCGRGRAGVEVELYMVWYNSSADVFFKKYGSTS